MILYHYIAKGNTALSEGILSLAANPQADLSYYYKRTGGETTHEGVVKWMESCFKGRSRAIRGFSEPIQWTEKSEKMFKDFIDSLFASGYRLRYSGGMVPDLHQILIKGGGLFSYPATQDAPNGKLRKLFEVFPMSFIYEQAGGEAIDGARRILDRACDSLHQSTPCFLGSKEEINALKQAYKEER